MNPEYQPSGDDRQAVAYDAQGRPLYYQPESPQNAQPITGKDGGVWSPELQLKHEESVKHYPEIQFSETEYVVIDVQRTIWGLAIIWLVALAAFAVILLFVVTMITVAEADPFTMFVLVSTLGVTCLLGGAVGQYVFRRNFFIVTNERILSRTQNSPFSYHTQKVEIEHIEDCSIDQNGPIQMMLNFGTIRLSTVGDEHTYRFTFVTRPEQQFRVVSEVIRVVDEDSTTKYRL